MIQIVSRWDSSRVLYTAETATTLRQAMEMAVAADADLRDADLSRADLRRADLRRADLSGADLGGADLSRADLRDADLGGADLRDADLGGADLSRADLRDADLSGADLSGADLSGVRDDVWRVLNARPGEVAGLLAAIEAGRIDGSCYEGECACLVGTIANVAQCNYQQLAYLEPNSDRPAEIWFLPLRPGDTPGTSQIAAITAGWIREWIAAHPVQP